MFLKTGLPTVFIVGCIRLERSSEKTVPFPPIIVALNLFCALAQVGDDCCIWLVVRVISLAARAVAADVVA